MSEERMDVMNTIMKSTVSSWISSRTICGLFLFTLCGAVVQAQNPTQPKRGFYPAGSYALSDLESINTANGNAILRIPLVSLPAGRGGLSAGVGLFYNSKIWESYSYEDGRFEDGSSATELRPSNAGGWRYGVRYEPQLVHRYDENQPTHVYCVQSHLEDHYVWKLKMRFPDGSEHIFRPSGRTDELGDNFFRFSPDGWMWTCGQPETHPVTTGMTYYSADGTFMRLTFAPDGDHDWSNNAWTLSLPDGTRVTGSGAEAPERIYDRNNNYVEIRNITYNSHPASEIADQLGRHIIVEYGPRDDQNYTETGRDYIHAWRTENGQPTELTWTIKWRGVSANNNSYYVNPNDINTGSAMFGPGTTGISEIDLPAQLGALSYRFAYNVDDPTLGGWGEVSSMTLPSGAQVKYRYGTNSFTGLAVDVLRNYPYEKELIYQREYDGTSVPVSELWQYSLTESICQITAPDLGITKEYFKQTNVDTWDSGLVYKTENPDGSVVERVWKQNIPSGYGTSTPAKANSYLKTEYTSVRNAAGALVKTAIKDYTYDKNGNLTQEADYDWVDYFSVPRDGAGNPSGALPFQPKRVTVNSYYNATPTADSTASDEDIYTQYTADNIRNALESNEVRSAFADTTALSRTELFYDNPSTLGNLIQQTSWDSTKGDVTRPLSTANSISVLHQYDTYGNPTLTTDAGLQKTRLVYGPVSGFTDLYPTEIKAAFDTSIVRTENREYDFRSGQVTRVMDVDNNVSSSTSYDVFGRPILVRAAEGKPEETRTVTNYSDANRRMIVRSDLNGVGDGMLVTIQHYDQLGRIRLTRQLEDVATQSATDETTGIKVQIRYAVSGSNSYQLTSSPYRASLSSAAGSEPSMGWIRSKNDNGGRLIEVQTFGGAALPDPLGSNSTTTGTVTSAYDGFFTTVTDQSSRMRRSMTDGLGRLVRVDEPDAISGNLDVNGSPVQSTDYEYDAEGNLRHVTQGQQQRFFMYDSLSRLIRASNPEQQTNSSLAITDLVTGHSDWSVKYEYDNSSNLTQKTDARGVVSTFVYDELNRNLSVVYSSDPANTPAITRTYDVATYGKGRLRSTQTSGSTGSLTRIDTYDALGRPKIATQTLGSQNYSVSYTYDLAGHVKTINYPSGHTVTNNYDNAGRTLNFAGNLGDGVQRYYATGISYSPFGGLSQEQLGTTTPIYNKLFYNSRGQLAEIREGLTPNNTSWQRGAIINFYDTCWGMCWDPNTNTGSSMPNNNGNLKTQQVFIPQYDTVDYDQHYDLFSQSYDYDFLNRLHSVNEGSWQQQYSYDRFGNRTIDQTNTWGAGINKKDFTVNTANNRLGVPGGQTGTMAYDNAGNLITDTYSGAGVTRAYDAENRMTAETQANNYVAGSYTYNADGQRVRRTVNGVETWQVYGFDGELLTEYAANTSPTSPQKEYGYRNGQLLITATVGSGLAANAPPESQTGAVATEWFANLLAMNNSIELPAWLNKGLPINEGSSISDTSMPLFAPSFSTASLSLAPPQSGAAKIAFASNRDGSGQIYLMNTDGTGQSRLTNNLTNDESPQWSPDNSRLVFQGDRDNPFCGVADIYVMNADGSGQTRLTSDAADDSAPAWSPDGTKIVFQSARNAGNYQVYAMNADGSGQINLSNSSSNDSQPSWALDGAKIAFTSDRDHLGTPAIYMMNANGSNQIRLTFGSAPFRDEQPVWSRDGSRIAFVSTRDSIVETWQETDDEGGILTRTRLRTNKEVYLMNADGTNPVRLTNTLENDDSPVWSPDGTKIVFRSDRERECCDPVAQIWAMNADGSSQVNLSNNAVGDYGPSWQPAAGNLPPSISITSPANGATFTAPASIAITASASDSDGSISRVDFYNATTLIGTAISAPYTFNWNNVAAGNYTLTAKATDNAGATTSSTAASFSVTQSGGGPTVELRWLVTDQLGTPRMIFDKTGTLANVKRHDYLPFGEELFNGARTTSMGYGDADSTRQKFTSKERDNETGLDWFGPGRYYSRALGRFTSIDPLGASAKPVDPQTWNRFAYVLNRPTIAIDPDGLSTIVVLVSPGAAPQATVMVFNRGGHDVAVRNGSNRIEGIATGQGRNRADQNNDTPYGVYQIDPNHMGSNANGTQGGTAGVSARGPDLRFGTGIVTMEPVSGEAFNARGRQVRDGIYIHGGGRPLTQALDPQQPLTPTEGCVRVHNEDVNALITTVNDLATNGDPISNIFIGDAATINAQADQRGRQGNYLYPQLRQAGFGSPDAQGNAPGNAPPPQQQRH
jgi:RHS repeat-associated protein